MEFIIAGVVIFAIGIVVGRLTKSTKHYGVIRVDTSDPDDDPYLFLVLHPDKNVNSIIRERRVTFKVDARNYISQK